ncbi:hypothetical protein [Aestuariimicrobium sp. T2.26MG-19.2B]|uniref:hypothetical protein n=1 Tax=Aestuariimicrobium sp. T2.26MG-19.2B TaxID=3040679 RepID=UPI0024773D09|nr:hypothetical protein [Aestuariimicrobium sp. T2.26MG-19.2B]CAI9399972.1 hypothetical protein AESSP_00299 [Aestuariimicrobium sp. T2.26MG-19.2B]
MIRLVCPPAPASLSSASTQRERDSLVAWYTDPTHGTTPWPGTFAAYKGDDVRAELTGVFSAKCAYCESYFGATQPLDVEHFRPKGKVVRERIVDGHTVRKLEAPGYWWLASTWMNLLPSCSDCNRPRRQELPLGLRATAGKANQFPVADESKRATAPGQEDAEPRLLLHPYLDDPPQHLHFVEAPGSIRDGEVEARPSTIGPGPSAMGVASIEVYALQRQGLVAARAAQLRLLRSHLVTIRWLLEDISTQGLTASLRDRFTHELGELEAFCAPTAPYSAMCRQVVDEFKRTHLEESP